MPTRSLWIQLAIKPFSFRVKKMARWRGVAVDLVRLRVFT
jgi:hypothetical protein